MNESRRQAPLVFIDGDVVRAHVPPAHVSTVIEFPVLVSVRAVPLSGVVVPLVFEASADAVSLGVQEEIRENMTEASAGAKGGQQQQRKYVKQN